MAQLFTIPLLEWPGPDRIREVVTFFTSRKGIESIEWQEVGKRFLVQAKNGDYFQLAFQALPKEKLPLASTSKRFPVSGMTCAACVNSVATVLEDTPGVIHAEVNLADNTASVEWLEGTTGPAEMKNALSLAGYELMWTEDHEISESDWEQIQAEELKKTRRQTLFAIVLSLPIVLISMVFMHLPYGNYIMWALSTPVVFWFGRRFFKGAWQQLQNRQANMDTLVALSTLIAYLFSVFNTVYPEYFIQRGLEAHVYFEAAAVIISFILLGKWLEARAKSQTSSAIKKLMGLQPEELVILTDDGQVEIIAASEAKAGQRILIKPGSQVPVDGQVLEGNSHVDESMITGEPMPVNRTTGDRVMAGTINQRGRLVILAEQVGELTVLSRIIRRVRQAQGSKAPVQNLVDKIAGIFVPVVILIAVVTFAIWNLSGIENAFTYGLLTMITVLVIACPCALGLATPTAIMVGIGRAAQQGILIRDAESLEKARAINVLVLDKTGTITEGKPAVQEVLAVHTAPPWHILKKMEAASEHPLGEAVVRYFSDEKEQVDAFESFESVTGKGVTANIHGMDYKAGNERFLAESNVSIPLDVRQWIEREESLARTVIYFSTEKELLGAISIADTIKESSVRAIRQLKKLNIEVHMLTGDHPVTAEAVAREVGIEKWKAGVLPDEKGTYIKQLRNEGKVVAMAGDGINDSEALALADVGIAMGQGTDIAMEVAKMTLMSSDLLAIPEAIRLSRKTVTTIRQNLFWAFIYNVIGIPIAAGVLYPISGFLLNPMFAGAAMALSSVSVVTNSLRLRYS